MKELSKPCISGHILHSTVLTKYWFYAFGWVTNTHCQKTSLRTKLYDKSNKTNHECLASSTRFKRELFLTLIKTVGILVIYHSYLTSRAAEAALTCAIFAILTTGEHMAGYSFPNFSKTLCFIILNKPFNALSVLNRSDMKQYILTQ